jgi:hypothetical protein
VPVAFAGSMAYCLLLTKVIVRFERISWWFWSISIMVLTGFVIEVLLLATLGAVRSSSLLGHGFFVAHLGVFFLGTPALANVLLLRKRQGLHGRWFAVVPLCTLFALVLVLLQYGVSEALYGIDGDDRSFSESTIAEPHSCDSQQTTFRSARSVANSVRTG